MKPLTALCFTCAGVSLGRCIAWPRADDPRRKTRSAARALAAIVIVVTLATLVERMFQLDAGLDELVLRDGLTATWLLHPGRMAPATALALLSLGIALLSIDARSRRATLLSQGAATLGALIGLLAIIGYLYDVGSLYHLFAYSSMAPHTSALFLALGFGTLFARPERGAMATVTSDYAGGSMARRILPVAIVVPTAAGGLWLVGERAGLYDNAFGTALFATSNILPFTTVAGLSPPPPNPAGPKSHPALQ